MKFISNIILIVFSLSLILSVSSCKNKAVSPTTGWEYNNPDNGGFEVDLDYYEQETGPGLVLVEGGTFSMGRVEQDVLYDWNNIPRRVTVSSFYMDMTEVRNVDYREYLYWITRVFRESSPEIYTQALPDTLVWREHLAYNEPYVEYYFRHPAYNNYPVVGVNWLQANEYCKWRTDRVNEDLLIQKGILLDDPNQQGEQNFNTDAYLVGQYEGLTGEKPANLDPSIESRNVRMEDGILLPKYRLPTEAEWEYAAYALIGNTVDERIYNRKLYPWNGHYVRNDTKENRGQINANFVRGRGDYMGVAGALNDNGSVPAPVNKYWPNDYGLYCMAGNVSEWVLDVYRPLSLQDVSGFRPFRGNVFKKLLRDEEGIIAEVDSMGRLQWEDVTDEECINRRNYKKADNINYLDGDLNSSIIKGPDWNSEEDHQGTKEMYGQGKGDKQEGMTSLINDEAMVYKGGSWEDRTYWLVPGTRRFLDKRQTRRDLGFRCAMTRVGSPGGF